MGISLYCLEGGHDIKEINELNPYIGMREVDRSPLIEASALPPLATTGPVVEPATES